MPVLVPQGTKTPLVSPEVEVKIAFSSAPKPETFRDYL